MPISTKRLPPPRAFRQSPRPNDTFTRYRGSKVPASGWTQETFQSAAGRKLIRDVLAVRKLAQRENTAKLSKALKLMFEEEMNLVLAEFANSVVDTHYRGKTIGSDLINLVITLTVPDGSERMWEDALNKVFADSPTLGRILKVFRPVYQSTMDHIVKKTSVLIPPPVRAMPPPVPGMELPMPMAPIPAAGKPMLPVTHIEVNPNLKQEVPLTEAQLTKLVTAKADKLCHLVTGISETTKKRMRAVFRAKINEGAKIGDVIKAMKEAFPQIATNRIPTIVRTELSRAANEAQIISFKNSLSVSHCSVVGCQAVEDNSPTYQGFHTCNIKNVGVDNLELVEFHINHTGSWVPTGFRTYEGVVPNLPLGNAPGIGHKDDPNALRHRDRIAAGLEFVAQMNRW